MHRGIHESLVADRPGVPRVKVHAKQPLLPVCCARTGFRLPTRYTAASD